MSCRVISWINLLLQLLGFKNFFFFRSHILVLFLLRSANFFQIAKCAVLYFGSSFNKGILFSSSYIVFLDFCIVFQLIQIWSIICFVSIIRLFVNSMVFVLITYEAKVHRVPTLFWSFCFLFAFVCDAYLSLMLNNPLWFVLFCCINIDCCCLSFLI